MINIKNIFTLSVSLCTCSMLSMAQHPTRPNIIYILADDLGYSDLGCFGQTKIETPHIDSLAKNGMLFSQHYAGSAVSAPSRCVLLTGKHSGHTYIRGNDELVNRGDVWSHQSIFDDCTLEGQRPLPTNTFTISHMMKNAGYVTACIGKWGLGYPNSESTPLKMGFDFFYGFNCQRMAHTYYPPFLYKNEKRVYLNNKVLQPGTLLDENSNPLSLQSYQAYSQNEYVPDLMFKEILSFIDRNKEKPFYLFWATPIPHSPLQAPARWIEHYVHKFGDEKPYLGEKGYFPNRYPHATYAAMVSYLDEQVGLLIEYLKETKLFENTLIIFTSGNGPAFSGGTDPSFFNSGGPFKSENGWGKTSLHEGGIRVPMIACWPNKITPNSYSNHISAFWDVMPTLAEITNTKCPNTDGISFLPTLLNKPQKKHSFLYWEFPEKDGSIAVRMDNWKGILSNVNKGNKSLALFDICSDPQELFDVASTYPNIVKTIKEIINKSHTRSDVEKFRFSFENN